MDAAAPDQVRRAEDAVRRAVLLGGLAPTEAQAVRAAAGESGVATIEPASPGGPWFVLAGEAALERLGAALEAFGQSDLGRRLRATLASYRRASFSIPFADGGVWELGGRTSVMGVLNVTPDSFSDGGRYRDPAEAAEAAARMTEEGADIVDVGGESSRPGSEPVSEDEEIRRVVPVVETLKKRPGARVCVDTRRASVARRAIGAGADMVNDVSAFGDPGMLEVVRASGVPAVAMHMRGRPRDMQRDTRYADLMSVLVDFLSESVQKAVAAGVPDDKLIVDPGIGFGKSAEGNLEILRQLPTLRSVGRPVLIGASRKSFIGAALDLAVSERLEGSLAVAGLAAWQGAHVVRVHDVAATVRVVRMIDSVRNG